MANDIVLYGLKGSPFVRKVQILMVEKGVEFDIEQASPFGKNAPEWFLEISPAKRIPVVRDRSIGSDGIAGTLPDSSVICLYLEDKYPSPKLYPSDAYARARAIWFEEYADTELATPFGMGMFRPMVMSRMMGGEPDVDTARKTLHEKLPRLFDYLEKSIDGREFLVGDTFSIADIGVATQFVNFDHTGAKVDSARWPNLADYVTRMHTRPSIAGCLDEERKMIPASDITL